MLALEQIGFYDRWNEKADLIQTESVENCIDNNGSDIAALHRVISKRIFNIKLDPQGNPQPQTDGQLAIDLLSTNQKVKSLALFQVLYYVRCNIVHGREGLQPYQVILLQPVINILSTINRQLYTSLRDYPPMP